MDGLFGEGVEGMEGEGSGGDEGSFNTYAQYALLNLAQPGNCNSIKWNKITVFLITASNV